MMIVRILSNKVSCGGLRSHESNSGRIFFVEVTRHGGRERRASVVQREWSFMRSVVRSIVCVCVCVCVSCAPERSGGSTLRARI